jgi:hypothetical protein
MMKTTMLSCLMLFASILFAQTPTRLVTRDVTKDSFSLVVKTDVRTGNRVWYENRLIEYNTGEVEYRSQLVGNNPAMPIPESDTSNILAAYAGIQDGLASNLVSAGRTLILQDVAIAKMLENNRALVSAGLPNLLRYMQDRIMPVFIDSTGATPYRFKVGTANWVNATMERNAQGIPVLKWGASNSRTLTFINPGFMVVNDYPETGKQTFLYALEPRWYESIDRNLKIVRNDN